VHLFTFELRLADGDDAGTIATNEALRVGDVAIAHGNRRYRVTAVVPVERVAEFIDGPTRGILEVEPGLGVIDTAPQVGHGQGNDREA
jgi:hypothetical protein